MKHSSFTSSHGFKKGDVIDIRIHGATIRYVVTNVTSTIADLKPYRWYHKLWHKIKERWHGA
jgi:hypothetical protein